MRAVRRLSAVIVVVVVGVLVGAGPAVAAPAESISSYDTRLDLTADGSLHVTETIAYDFGSLSRHGIFRKIPARFRYNDSDDRVYPIGDVTVTQDDSAVPVERSTGDGYVTLKIGDPNVTISGAHHYVISYTVTGALNGFPDHQELFWNAVGTEWTVPIAQATATVSGPAEIQRVGCFAGPQGSQLACDTGSTQGRTATFAQSNLAAGEGLTVVVAFPPGTFSSTAPVLEKRHDLANAFHVSALTVVGGAVLLLLGIGAVLFALWRVGRDRYYLGQLPGLAPGPGEAAVQRAQAVVRRAAGLGGVRAAGPDQAGPGRHAHRRAGQRHRRHGDHCGLRGPPAPAHPGGAGRVQRQGLGAGQADRRRPEVPPVRAGAVRRALRRPRRGSPFAAAQHVRRRSGLGPVPTVRGHDLRGLVRRGAPRRPAGTRGEPRSGCCWPRRW